ncbi:winged helix DNA-binding protein [Paenibacillus sp. FSL R5-0636]|uniref:winged helix DNA-binding protein n=1 Tax=Paenibacillus sp. FSL R5-0636 TaxID=2921652 RepID=UPI00096EC742|nr:MarR family transcriptional regulator [Paenibacillus odorifer]OMD17423.1 MarR family transcriptional regulator [Paenibacillus odorifer]OME46890.1 MarR family transcriptional regulator [Paenibacillus odorifer]OME53015.1 MarR family transcriptional regulator [Paenibacillus odorifer]
MNLRGDVTVTHSFENLPNKDILIKKLIEKIPQLQKRFQSEDDEEKEWLIQNCSNPLIIDFLQDSTVMMLHVIDAIGQLEPVNGTTISKQFGIPKGSVSKITRRLVQQEIIRTEFLPDNKKEVLFLTTPLGKEIFDLHLALHKQMNKGINRFLQRYNTDELLFIIQAFEDTLEASWVHSESVAEKELLTTGASLEPVENDEMSQIVDMLNQLDTRNLKKAKAVLQAMFFTPFD